MSKRPAPETPSEAEWGEEDEVSVPSNSESDSWENASGKFKKPTLRKSTAKRRRTGNLMREPSQSYGRILEVGDFKHPRSQHSIHSAGPIRNALVQWFASVRDSRGMPWRKPLEPSEELTERTQRAYEVWVSEVMLQQTQVATVIPYYNRWMETFPTLNDLAKADVDQVNALWKGLGYYSRARRLLEGAVIAVKDYGGKLPDNAEQMQAKIPGIGRYSAGAICSIAYGERVPVLDGNVHRLLSRFLALYARPKAKATLDILWRAADVMVQAGETAHHPGDINQALIELGSTVCKVREPSCDTCPLRPWCSAYATANNSGTVSGLVDIEDVCDICEPVAKGCAITTFPMKPDRKRSREELDVANVIEWRHGLSHQRLFLLVKRPESGLLAGLYDFATSTNVPRNVSYQTVKDGSLGLLNMLVGGTFHEATGPSARCKASGTNTRESVAVKISLAGDVSHTFSHIKKTYRVVWVVVTGGDKPPELNQDPEQDGPSEKSFEQRGLRSKFFVKNPGGMPTYTEKVWFPLNEVASANMGTGSMKVWNLAKGFWEKFSEDS